MERIAESLKGHFLMAMPGLRDPNFSQTVSIICEHNEGGAFGIVINRVHPHLSGKDIFNELDIVHESSSSAVAVHIGGPVHAGEIFLVHGPPFDWESTLMVTATIGMSNSRDILESVAAERGPRSFLISLGCSGWGPGQLEAELRENAWLTFPVADEIVFDWPVEHRWAEAVKRMGIDPALLTQTAGNA
jgi:putative transcriptional regulator